MPRWVFSNALPEGPLFELLVVTSTGWQVSGATTQKYPFELSHFLGKDKHFLLIQRFKITKAWARFYGISAGQIRLLIGTS